MPQQRALREDCRDPLPVLSPFMVLASSRHMGMDAFFHKDKDDLKAERSSLPAVWGTRGCATACRQASNAAHQTSEVSETSEAFEGRLGTP